MSLFRFLCLHNNQTIPHMKMVNFKLLLLMLLCAGGLSESIISSMDFTTNVVSASYAYNNVVGVSMYFPEVLPYWNSPIFAARINLTRFEGWYSNMFSQYLHVPKGYKYNCSSALYSANITCIYDIALNSSLATTISKFFYDYGNYYAIDLGYDIEGSDFSNSKYMSNFQTYMDIFSRAGINLELIDYGDKIESLYNHTYTVDNFLSDIDTIYDSYYGLFIDGPGITEDADSSWVAQLPTLYDSYYTTFTFRCTLFRDSSDATIANLLHENYSSIYLRKRMVDENNEPLDHSSYAIGINQIRLTNDSGIHGVTNSFAAALWALDISVSFASLPGYSINFYNPLTPSNQSVFGAGPEFSPGAIYYGILFACYSLRDNPTIQTVTITSGTSQSIKVYGLDLYNDYRILIINKDLNSNISGVVNVKHDYPNGFRCYYLSAPTLSSTSNITFAGMHFEGNNANYVGQFEYADYKPSPLMVYSIKLNYSQAVLCEQIPSSTYTELPRGRSKQLGDSQATFYTLLLLIAILAMQ